MKIPDWALFVPQPAFKATFALTMLSTDPDVRHLGNMDIASDIVINQSGQPSASALTPSEVSSLATLVPDGLQAKSFRLTKFNKTPKVYPLRVPEHQSQG